MEYTETNHDQDNIDLSEMLVAQIELDELVFHNAGTDREKTQDKRTIALVGEVVEVADEIPYLWKYWKKNIKPVDDPALIEELADVLHFILSKGVDVGAKYNHDQITYYRTSEEQLKALMKWATLADVNEQNWRHLLSTFRGLLYALGIKWNMIHTAYFMKNLKNRDRQKNNY